MLRFIGYTALAIAIVIFTVIWFVDAVLGY